MIVVVLTALNGSGAFNKRSLQLLRLVVGAVGVAVTVRVSVTVAVTMAMVVTVSVIMPVMMAVS